MKNGSLVKTLAAGTLLVLVACGAQAQQQAQGLLAEKGKSSSRSKKSEAPPPAPASASVASKDPADYTIGEQDVLMINVWKEPELSGVVMVRPDGKITLPLVNEVSVVGMRPTQVQALITEKLQPFLTVPQVTVTVREISSRKVYVIGQVGKEGGYAINSTTTVLQIIAEAGGLRDFANRKHIYVLRNENGKQVRFPFNYAQVIRGKNAAQNIVLRPGDTVVVP
jgi:polysaccharide export outer membrane protein